MTQAPRLKGDKRYRDAPRFPVIFSYEAQFRSAYKKRSKMMAVDLSKKIKEFIFNNEETSERK